MTTTPCSASPWALEVSGGDCERCGRNCRMRSTVPRRLMATTVSKFWRFKGRFLPSRICDKRERVPQSGYSMTGGVKGREGDWREKGGGGEGCVVAIVSFIPVLESQRLQRVLFRLEAHLSCPPRPLFP